jgi:hypothetical protein
MSEILIGRTDEGEKVYVEARIEVRNTGEWQTTEHETIKDPVTLAFSGVVIRKGGSIKRDGDWVSGGQVLDYVRRVTPQVNGWSAEDLAKLATIWERWHLNTMRAGCAHQPAESVVYEDSPYGRRVDLDATPACPVTGYRYGSAWLTEAVPDDVLEWVRQRFELAQ